MGIDAGVQQIMSIIVIWRYLQILVPSGWGNNNKASMGEQ